MAVPARVPEDEIALTFRGPRGLRAVRFRSELAKRGDPPEFRRRGRSLTWELHLPRPVGVDRVEYLLELVHTDGTAELSADPANPLVASGPFGDKSVLELPGYHPPVWLDEEADGGSLEPLSLRSRLLRAEVTGLLWRSAGSGDDGPLPLLVVHDGPEYAEFSALTRMLDAAVAQLELPPMRAALLQPVRRNETYSAAKRYADALATELVPALPPTQSRVGMGASLGALAMLHAHRVHPDALRRPLPAVRELLPPRARRLRAHLPALRADRALRRRRTSRARLAAPGPGHDDVRAGRGEPRQQPRHARRARRAELPGRARGAPRRAQLGFLARRARPPPHPPLGALCGYEKTRFSSRAAS